MIHVWPTIECQTEFWLKGNMLWRCWNSLDNPGPLHSLVCLLDFLHEMLVWPQTLPVDSVVHRSNISGTLHSMVLHILQPFPVRNRVLKDRKIWDSEDEGRGDDGQAQLICEQGSRFSFPLISRGYSHARFVKLKFCFSSAQDLPHPSCVTLMVFRAVSLLGSPFHFARF